MRQSKNSDKKGLGTLIYQRSIIGMDLTLAALFVMYLIDLGTFLAIDQQAIIEADLLHCKHVCYCLGDCSKVSVNEYFMHSEDVSSDPNRMYLLHGFVLALGHTAPEWI